MNIRQERMAEAVKQELGEILRNMKDPRIGLVSVVSVEVTRDFREAKVFISALGDDKEKQTSLEALANARGYIRSEIARRLQSRYTPELHFHADETIAHGARIAELLKTLGDESPADTDAGPGAQGEGDYP